MYKVSVIVPIYNAEKDLEKTICNIQKQSLRDIEIICVNDGSEDRSGEIIKHFQKKDPRIKYFFQSNKGAGAARNLGIDHAKGKYIAFLDADDKFVNPQVIEKLYYAAEKNNAFICGGKVEGCSRKNDSNFPLHNGFVEFYQYQQDYFFWRYIYNRYFLAKNDIRFPELRVYEDPVFLVKAMIKAQKFYVIEDVVYSYSGSHQSQNMDIEKAIDYMQGIITELDITSKYKLAKLHKTLVNRLEKECCYYIEKHLYSNNQIFLKLLIKANSVIDSNLIECEEDYVLPAITSLWDAGRNYMRLRNSKLVRMMRKVIKGKWFRKGKYEC